MSKTSRADSAPVTTVPLCIEFLLDETGSMTGHLNAVINGFNDFLKEQSDFPGQCLMTLTKFEGGNLSVPYEDLSLGLVPKMTTNTFVPAGMTNLFDAIGSRIDARAAALEQWTVAPNVLFVVMTDGGDNMSTAYSVDSIREKLRLAQERGWTAVYLGADQNALAVGTRMGFQEGNIKAFSSSEMRQTMQTLARATTAYRTTGATATSTFFQG